MIRNNVARMDGGGFEQEGPTLVSIINATITGNSARRGGGTLLRGGIVFMSQVAVHNNTAHLTGGGVACDTGSDVSIHSSTFSNNMASRLCEGKNKECGSGGGMSVIGQNVKTRINKSKFIENTAENEGGCIFTAGTSSVKILQSALSKCVSTGDGGGISSRGASRLVLSGSIIIRQCRSVDGNGGGIAFAGEHLSVQRSEDNSAAALLLERNSGMNGGGISMMATVELFAGSSTMLLSNIAMRNGGGAYAFSGFGELAVDTDASLLIEDNEAYNGAGVAVVRGAQFRVAVPECVGIGGDRQAAECTLEMRENARCDLSCMTKSCNCKSSSVKSMHIASFKQTVCVRPMS